LFYAKLCGKQTELRVWQCLPIGTSSWFKNWTTRQNKTNTKKKLQYTKVLIPLRNPAILFWQVFPNSTKCYSVPTLAKSIRFVGIS